MKKGLIFLSVILVFFLSSCNEQEEAKKLELSGKYYYYECVYLNPLSSATIDHATNQYKDLVYIQILSDTIVYYDGYNETKYEDITYKNETIDKDFDTLLSMGFEDVFQYFDERYDVYSEGTSIGITIFVKDDDLYIADTDYIGGSKDIFTIWSVAKIKQNIEAEFCQKAEYEMALSGIFYTLTTTRCETKDYTFEYTTKAFLDSSNVYQEDVILEFGNSHLLFTKCDVTEQKEYCTGEWTKRGETNLPLVDVFSFQTLNRDSLKLIEETDGTDWLRANYEFETILSNDTKVYIKLGEDNEIEKVFYSVFPSYEITYIEYDDILELPSEIIALLSK